MNTDNLVSPFPDSVLSQITSDTGLGISTVEIDGENQCFAYGYESYSGSSLGIRTGCFPNELECLTGIATARLMSWDVAGIECGPRF